jgi:pilus assembly protein CpaE
MNRAVIAIADQVLVQELRSRLDQSEAEIEVAFIAESTQEMASSVLAHRPSIAFVHDQLGPGSVLQVIRDLTLRNPALAVLLVTTSSTADAYAGALNAGARGVLTHPFGLEDLNNRLESMLEWNSTVRNVLVDQEHSGPGAGRGGRVIAAAGAKGGVGTTVIASHLAWDTARSLPQMRVCLVDLDVESGDVPSYIDVSNRVSIADLAKISEDLTARAVTDTVVMHSSGLHLLLTPTEIRDTEFVTPEAVRLIIAQLRTLYHLVVVDVGSAITTTQAAAVESADMTMQVVTADVPALRAARRQVVAWESLGVAGADRVHVVVNRFVRRSEIQQDTIDQLVLGQRSSILIPDLDRGLERAGNSRTPGEVRNQVWWRSLRTVATELDVALAYREAVAAAAAGEPAAEVEGDENGSRRRRVATGQAANGKAAEPVRRKSRPRRVVAESGQASLETVAIFPFALMFFAIGLQMIMIGISFAYSGVAADAAARAVSLGTSPQAAVADALPAGMSSKVSVTAGGDTVVVTVRAPLVATEGWTREVSIDVNHQVVEEPR